MSDLALFQQAEVWTCLIWLVFSKWKSEECLIWLVFSKRKSEECLIWLFFSKRKSEECLIWLVFIKRKSEECLIWLFFSKQKSEDIRFDSFSERFCFIKYYITEGQSGRKNEIYKRNHNFKRLSNDIICIYNIKYFLHTVLYVCGVCESFFVA